MNITAPKVVIDTNILVATIGRKSPFRWIFDAIIDAVKAYATVKEILTALRDVYGVHEVSAFLNLGTISHNWRLMM